MQLYSEDKDYKLYQGNMLDMLEVIQPNSIDSIITDPPYGLTTITKRFGGENSKQNVYGKDGSFQRLTRGFMGKEWDGSGIEYNVDAWKKCYEVLKEGGYLLAFGGTRTYHRIACAIEDAGFEIRDTIMWLYGSGFPKSMNISKGIEAKIKHGNAGTRNKRLVEQECDTEEYTIKQTNNGAMGEIREVVRKEYVPSMEIAKEWEGWGTCLKPAYEPIIVARKPFSSSLIDNILENGVGALNIDECRVAFNGDMWQPSKAGSTSRAFQSEKMTTADGMCEANELGRFPANVILTYDDTDKQEVCGGLPDTTSTYKEDGRHETEIHRENADILRYGYAQRIEVGYNDEGSAARYFYCAKASKKDRDSGMLDFEATRKCGYGYDLGYMNSGEGIFKDRQTMKKNIHPTVKPVELMQYLVRLVSPKGATILDCFMGSGSTGKAVMFENRERHADYKFIGIELTEEYLPICKSRIDYGKYKYEYDIKQEQAECEKEHGFIQQSIFDI